MTEPAFREIQLTKKQLVFVFMASVVFAAVVFLLGVSLGKRLPATTAAGLVTPAADELPAEMPPPTVLTADDQRFASELQGNGQVPPPLPLPPAPVPAPAPVEPADSSTATPAPAPASVPTPAPAAAKATTSATSGTNADRPAAVAPEVRPAPPAATAQPASSGEWFVQINAFRSRENADSEVRQLKSKGVTAFVSSSGSLFRVRVGPFKTRDDANSTATRLRQQGFKPSVTR